MVIPAARTGRDKRSSTAVTRTAQTNKGSWYIEAAAGFIFRIVVIKLIAPRIEDTPARWREKMVRSTDGPAWARFPAKGG